MKHTTAVDILEALDGYMLYVTIIIGMILFRAPMSRVVAARDSACDAGTRA
jgi:hypothetical protein